jgi:DNA-binding MarR family transcriptional regulator
LKRKKVEIFSIPHSVALLGGWVNEELRIGLKKLNLEKILPNYAPSLKILVDHGGEMAITSLAEKSQNSKPYITQMVNVLEKSGYVIRKSMEKDKRISLVSLTEKGYEAQKKIAQLIEEITLTKFTNFSDEELYILALLLNKITKVTYDGEQ